MHDNHLTMIQIPECIISRSLHRRNGQNGYLSIVMAFNLHSPFTIDDFDRFFFWSLSLLLLGVDQNLFEALESYEFVIKSHCFAFITHCCKRFNTKEEKKQQPNKQNADCNSGKKRCTWTNDT